MQGLELSGKRILVGLANGKPFACEDKCPHAGALLSLGKLKGQELQCARHGWLFNAVTGESLPGPTAFCLRLLKTEVRDGTIWVEV